MQNKISSFGLCIYRYNYTLPPGCREREHVTEANSGFQEGIVLVIGFDLMASNQSQSPAQSPLENLSWPQ
jgi:hypothetical protein